MNMIIKSVKNILLILLVLSACQSGDQMPPPVENAGDASDLIVAKKWVVKDAGLIVSSFRENSGKPYTYTMNWFGVNKQLGGQEKAAWEKYSKAIFNLEKNSTPNDGTGNIAKLEGFDLGTNQHYYFTSTQEENVYDRVVRVHIITEDPNSGQTDNVFTILGASGGKLFLLTPLKFDAGNLVMLMENQ